MNRIIAFVVGVLAIIVFLGFFLTKKFVPEDTPLLPSSPEELREGVNTTGMPLSLAKGFSIGIFARNLDNPRDLAVDSDGNLLVSNPSSGKVVAMVDKDQNGVSEARFTVLSGLDRPHGLIIRDDKLYVAETNGVSIYDYKSSIFEAKNPKKIVDLPAGGNHFTRSIEFAPDNRLLVSVGSSCNVCIEGDWQRAKILAYDETTQSLSVFASGLRNSVFMTVHPNSKKIWATEMGRDLLGDDLPPDEINIIEEGKDYGWPNCFGKNIPDRNFSPDANCTNLVASYIDIPAHSAPLGLSFMGEEGWPSQYKNNLLVSYHGSWNRSKKTGYKIVRYKLDKDGKYLGEEDFISGWLTKNEEVLGRPVDILVQPGGILYISDDQSGVVYRVSYAKNKTLWSNVVP